MTDASCGTGNDYPIGAPDFTFGFHIAVRPCCSVIVPPYFVGCLFLRILSFYCSSFDWVVSLYYLLTLIMNC